MRRKKPERKFKDRIYEKVKLPYESYGICVINHCYRHRRGIETLLGNFLCVNCYDRGTRGPNGQL